MGQSKRPRPPSSEAEQVCATRCMLLVFWTVLGGFRVEQALHAYDRTSGFTRSGGSLNQYLGATRILIHLQGVCGQ